MAVTVILSDNICIFSYRGIYQYLVASKVLIQSFIYNTGIGMPKSTVGIVLSNEMTREILLKLPAKDYIDSRNVDVRKCKVTLEFCGIKHMDMWKCDC